MKKQKRTSPVWSGFAGIQSKFPNSSSINDLTGSFKSNAKAFVDALKAAKANVAIEATLRHPKRAAVMHWAYKVAKGTVKAAKVPKISGVDIEWDHGDDKKSVAAAKAMIGPSGFKIVHLPSLTSNHIKGTAIDMTITWSGDLKIKNKKGDEVTITTSPRNGAKNTELHAVGATYGVKKLLNDAPYWSENGR